MANCFLCGAKVGMFDVGAYIENIQICSSCDTLLRNNVNNVFAMCHTDEELDQSQKLIVEKFQTQFSDDKLEVLKKHIAHIKNIYSANMKKNNEPYASSDPVANLNAIYQKKIDSYMLTTGYSFHGYEIEKYLGLVSGDCVIGTGIIADFFSDFSDLTGSKSKTFSNKMKEIKQEALTEMIKDSIELGANAIIGITYDHITFSGKNMIGISVNGTAVKITSVI